MPIEDIAEDCALETVALESEQIARREIARIPLLWQELINGELSLF